MRKVSKFFSAVLAAVMAVGVVASGASVVKAAGKEVNPASFDKDMEWYAETAVGDFTFVGNDSKAIRVQTPGEDVGSIKATDGKEFTQFLKFDGGANQIKFKASKGDKVVVYAQSGGSDDRQVGLFSTATIDEAGKNTALEAAAAPSTDSAASVTTFTVPEDGEYYIASVSKGIRILYLSVGEVAAKKDNVPKTGVISAAAVCGVVALAGAGVAVVTGKKKEN